MIKKFAEELAGHKKPGLISHISPDGDAIGSQLALFHWFRQRKIDAVMFNDDPVPSNLTWLKQHEHIQVPEQDQLDQCDCIIFVDGNHPSRFGKSAPFLEATDKPLYLIDHHLEPPKELFRNMWWDHSASSTAYLVYELFAETGLEQIDKDVAEALYCGIVTDTGSFRFDSVTAETHFAIGKIIETGGIKPSDIHAQIYDDKNLDQYHLLGMALNNIELYCGDRVATTHVTEDMLTKTGCTAEDIEGFVNYPLSIKGVVVSMIFHEREGRVKVSLRGKSVMDLNQIARKFNGGGHFNAAGAWHSGPISKAKEDLVSALADMF